MRHHTITIAEEDRQLILLALATLALERPGFDYALSTIALLMDNRTADGHAEMYEEFKRLNLDKHTEVKSDSDTPSFPPPNKQEPPL